MPTDTELRAIAEAATQGPWHASTPPLAPGHIYSDAPRAGSIVNLIHNDEREANARHISTFDPPTVIALLDRIATLEADNARLRETAQAFLDKYAVCSPHINDAFLHMALRCGDYAGPQFGEEIEALRAALTALADQPKPTCPHGRSSGWCSVCGDIR